MNSLKMERGFRGKLDDFTDTSQPLQIKIRTAGRAVYDSCCFGVDEANQLSDDRYMVFYNQTSSPGGEITYAVQGAETVYHLRLTELPAQVNKLVFTVSIDGNGTMGEITSCVIEVVQNGNVLMQLSLTGSDFEHEKAIIGLEVYRKTVWRIAAVARGFNGGLGDLLHFYGGEIAEPEPAQSQPAAPPNPPPAVPRNPAASPNPLPAVPKNTAPAASEEAALTNKLMNKISLSKDKVNLEKHVVNLSKCVVDLSKKSRVDLGNMVAKVVVALDYSYSMSDLYTKGVVQQTLNRLVPLGLTFDDNGAIDVFLFQSDCRKMPDLDLTNYENYVKKMIQRSDYPMGGTNYAPVLRAIIEGTYIQQGGFLGFGRTIQHIPAIVDQGDPTLILFITDGENADRTSSDAIIRKSSEMNVFIQFIGIGNQSFNYLKQLDDMPGRKRDNTGFSRMKDLAAADDRLLYTTVLEQFANWLKGLQ